MKEDFWYAVLILEFTGLNVCNTFIRGQNFNSILTEIIDHFVNLELLDWLSRNSILNIFLLAHWNTK